MKIQYPLPPPGKTGWPWDFTPAQIQASFDTPRVTIVTPSFNQADYLEETIRSVLLQGYPNLEYFIMDGGSTDGSVEIIKKYEPWLAGWVSEKDRGQSHAINKGFLRATGEWLGWLNSDDCFAPYALFNLLKTAHDTQAGFIYGACVEFGANPRGMTFPRLDIPGARAFDFETIRMADFIIQPASLWRREVYEECGPLAEDLHYVFDWDYFIRCAKHAKGAVCPRPIATYRFHESNKTSGLDLRRNEELVGMSLKYLPLPLRSRFTFIIPLIRFLKKMAWMQVHGVWVMRKLANIALLPLWTDWLFRLFRIPIELQLVYGYRGTLPADLVKLKISSTPAHTTAEALACFPEVWEVPE